MKGATSMRKKHTPYFTYKVVSSNSGDVDNFLLKSGLNARVRRTSFALRTRIAGWTT